MDEKTKKTLIIAGGVLLLVVVLILFASQCSSDKAGAGYRQVLKNRYGQ